MTVMTDRKLCPSCGLQVFPRLVTAPEERRGCGHVLALWIYPCTCGGGLSERPDRCPFCSGNKPKETDNG